MYGTISYRMARLPSFDKTRSSVDLFEATSSNIQNIATPYFASAIAKSYYWAEETCYGTGTSLYVLGIAYLVANVTPKLLLSQRERPASISFHQLVSFVDEWKTAIFR